MNTEKETADHTDGVPPLGGDPLFADMVSKNVGQRIREARGLISQRTLAEQINVHVNTIGKFERGETVPDAVQLYDIALVTKTNPAWLLCGEKYPKNSADSSGALYSGDGGDLALVPAYGVKASAGNGEHVNEEQVIGRFAFKREWLARKGLNANNLAVVAARGDSMEPTVRDGDILLVDRNVDRISTDGIYLIERENDLFCKRLQRSFDGGVTIMSDNPRYGPQQLSTDAASELNIVGRVIWIGGER
jgi:phage repressor protein C with HTH and peptisase S24 domain